MKQAITYPSPRRTRPELRSQERGAVSPGVILDLVRDLDTGMSKLEEQRLVEQLVAHRAIDPKGGEAKLAQNGFCAGRMVRPAFREARPQASSNAGPWTSLDRHISMLSCGSSLPTRCADERGHRSS